MKVPSSTRLAQVLRWLAPALFILVATLDVRADVAPSADNTHPNRVKLKSPRKEVPKVVNLLDDECEPLEDEHDGTELHPIALLVSRADARTPSGADRIAKAFCFIIFTPGLSADPAWRPAPESILDREGHFLAVARPLRAWMQSRTC